MTLHQPIMVLIVDDDADDRFFMEQAFRADSIHTQVYLADGGYQALNLLAEIRPLPDVILLDLNMPGMTGFEVLEQVKQSVQYQSIRVVILTTSEATTDQERARQLGAAEFITKPTTYGGLGAIAERLRLTLVQ